MSIPTELYYFSGTGNSLFVARQLQARLPDAVLLPIASLVGGKSVKAAGKVVGFVFPVHALTIPLIIKRFLRKIDLREATYVFAVATRFGTEFFGFKAMDRLLRRQQKKLDAHFLINLCNNEARHENYCEPSIQVILQKEDAALRKIDEIAAIVNARQQHRPADTEYAGKISENPYIRFILKVLVLCGMALSEHVGGVQYFYADERCTGCGVCEKVCLSGKICMRDHKPHWQRSVLCSMCFACLNYCPQQSVQINSIVGVPSFTKENGRYMHPYASVQDIHAQKERLTFSE